MGTYGYIDLDVYVRISGHISAHNGTYLVRNLVHRFDVYVRISGHISAHNGTYLARDWVRRLRLDSYPIPLLVHALFGAAHYRFASDSTTASRSVRSSSAQATVTGLLSVTASGVSFTDSAAAARFGAWPAMRPASATWSATWPTSATPSPSANPPVSGTSWACRRRRRRHCWTWTPCPTAQPDATVQPDSQYRDGRSGFVITQEKLV